MYKASWKLTVAFIAGASLMGASNPGHRPHSYDLSEVDQRTYPSHPDIMPDHPLERQHRAAVLAETATVYGMAPVLQYQQMYEQALHRGAKGYTGFNVFRHDRSLAGPGYQPFKTPNADTLYSNAWLDLTGGPVVLTVPPTGKTYYTASLLDMYGNASNVSTRTFGNRGGRYLIVPVGWRDEVPAGMTKFVVATPYTWVLLRILVEDPVDVSRENKLQNAFRLTSPASMRPRDITNEPQPDADSAAGYFRILDWVLRNNGYPIGEEALVYSFHSIGLAGDTPLETALADGPVRAGIDEGFARARQSIHSGRHLNGYPAGTWKMPADSGALGYNYYYRAIKSVVGTGGNLSSENYPFNTASDEEGDPLDGSKGKYRLTLDPPPPVNYFWSVTLYDARTRELVSNPQAKYLVGDRTPGLKRSPVGAVEIVIQRDDPGSAYRANWLPAPAGPFYLVLRAQGPKPELLQGRWVPNPVRKVAP